MRIALPPGCFRIGRDLDNDIVLADPAVAPSLAQIVVDARGARLRPLVRGYGIPCRLITADAPAELRFGATTLCIEAGAAVGRQARPRGVLLLGTVALLLGLGGAALSAGALAPAPTARSETAREAGSARAKPVQATVMAPDASRALAERLAAAGLLDAIALATLGDALLARGTITPEALPAWRAVQQWYDATYHQGPVLLRQVSETRLADRPRLAVQAVWTGAMPYLIAADGERYGEGAVIDGGWTIERIEATRILLGRGGRTVALAF
jgi:type III secretion protein D